MIIIFFLSVVSFTDTPVLSPGKDVVPEPPHEAQETAAEIAGRAQSSGGDGAHGGQLQREGRDGQERTGGAQTRHGAGLVRAGGERRRGRGRGRCGHRGRRVLSGPSTIVGCSLFPLTSRQR